MVAEPADVAAGPRLVGEPVAEHAKVFESIVSQNAEGALREMAFLIDAALADTITVLSRAPSQSSLVAASA